MTWIQIRPLLKFKDEGIWQKGYPTSVAHYPWVFLLKQIKKIGGSIGAFKYNNAIFTWQKFTSQCQNWILKDAGIEKWCFFAMTNCKTEKRNSYLKLSKCSSFSSNFIRGLKIDSLWFSLPSLLFTDHNFCCMGVNHLKQWHTMAFSMLYKNIAWWYQFVQKFLRRSLLHPGSCHYSRGWKPP